LDQECDLGPSSFIKVGFLTGKWDNRGILGAVLTVLVDLSEGRCPGKNPSYTGSSLERLERSP
jgi:hypothetical protein